MVAGVYALESHANGRLVYVRLPDHFECDGGEVGAWFSRVGRRADRLRGFEGQAWATWVRMGRVRVHDDVALPFRATMDRQRELLKLHVDAATGEVCGAVDEYGDSLLDQVQLRALQAELQEVRYKPWTFIACFYSSLRVR